MNYCDQLNTVLTLTRRMLEAAKAGGWEQVVQLEEKRQSLLNLLDKLNPDSLESNNSDVMENLQTLISLNEEILELSTMEKLACFGRFSSNKNNKKAFNAYTGK